MPVCVCVRVELRCGQPLPEPEKISYLTLVHAPESHCAFSVNNLFIGFTDII